MTSLVILILTRILLSECSQKYECPNNVNKLSNCDVDVNKDSEESLRDWIKEIENRQFLNNAPQYGSQRRCSKKEIQFWYDGVLEKMKNGWSNMTLDGKMTIVGHFEDMCLQDGLVLVSNDGAPCDMVGRVAHGHVSGPVWCVYPAGQGALYNVLTAPVPIHQMTVSLMTGEHVTWVYPDHVTLLSGQFVAGTMLVAREARLVGHSNNGAVPLLTIEETSDKEVFTFDPSTDVHMTNSPLLRDPMESKFLRVARSRIPGAGNGVFAVTDLAAGSIVGYFNGVHLTREEVFRRPRSEQSVYIVEGVEENEMLDVLPEFTSWSQYQASAGHLINHGKDGNVDYTQCFHPRFGNVLCVVTIKDIKKGQELLVTYDVSVDEDGMKFALKTALQFGQMISGKSRKEFAREFKPFMKIVSNIASNIQLSDIIQF